MKYSEKDRIKRIKALSEEYTKNEEKKEKKLEEVKIKCQEAIDKINKILSQNEEKRNKYGLRDEHFFQIKKELKKMKQILNKDEYVPSYGRYMLDFQYVDENLFKYLSEVSYFYKKYT